MSWWYSWVVSSQLSYLTCVTKFEPLCSLKKIVFKYCVCVRSFVAEGKWIFSTVTVGDHFPRIVFSLVNKEMPGEQEEVFVATEFTVQVSTFVELKLLWNR